MIPPAPGSAEPRKRLRSAPKTAGFAAWFRAEFLNRELFDTLLEAKVLTERWRHEYNTVRPHSSLGYRPPAPEAVQPKSAAGVR